MASRPPRSSIGAVLVAFLIVTLCFGCTLAKTGNTVIVPIAWKSPSGLPGEPQEQLTMSGLLVLPPHRPIRNAIRSKTGSRGPSLVVLIPGGLQSAENGLNAARYLAASGHVVAVPSPRGRGGSAGRITFAHDEVDDVKDLIDHVVQNTLRGQIVDGSPVSVALVGFSHGAVIALNAAFSNWQRNVPLGDSPTWQIRRVAAYAATADEATWYGELVGIGGFDPGRYNRDEARSAVRERIKVLDTTNEQSFYRLVSILTAYGFAFDWIDPNAETATTPDSHARDYAQRSPATRITESRASSSPYVAADVEVLVIHATCDSLVPLHHSRDLQRALSDARYSVTRKEIDGDHVPEAGEALKLIRTIAKFIEPKRKAHSADPTRPEHRRRGMEKCGASVSSPSLASKSGS